MVDLAERSVDPETGEAFDVDAARDLTERIRAAIGAAWDLLTVAWRSQAWRQLGYLTWDAYLAGEFSEVQLRPPREKRREVVASMIDQGMSVRAIAAATDTPRSTIHDDQAAVAGRGPASDQGGTAQVSGNRTPEAGYDEGCNPGPDIDEMVAQVEPDRPVTLGLDGKRYRRRNPIQPATPKPEPTAEELAEAKAVRDARKLDALAEAWPVVGRLTGEHRERVLAHVSPETAAWLRKLKR